MIERYTLSAHEDFTRRELYVARGADPDGLYMVAADVLAKMAEIREAVDEYRGAAVAYRDAYTVWHLTCQRCGFERACQADLNLTESRYANAQIALDALLAVDA